MVSHGWCTTQDVRSSALRVSTPGIELYSKSYSSFSIPPKPSNPNGGTELQGDHLRVRINISGELYETLEATLARFPDTLLGCPERRKQFFDENRQEYFFNRNRIAFDAILFYYQSNGLLTRPNNVRLQEFCDELRFFQIGEETLKEFTEDEGELEDDSERDVEVPANRIMRTLWLWFEHPKYSKVSRLIALCSVSFITLSVIVLCAESMEKDTMQAELNQVKDSKRQSYYDDIETACITWFTVEFLLRLISCPNKLKFTLNALNIIDLVAITPYYCRLTLNKIFKVPDDVAESLLFLRLVRLFKFARYVDELKVLTETVRSTWRELLMMLFFILIATTIFSACTFYVEYEAQKESFSSIPATAWFVIVSIANVGYGDMVPVTLMGKFLGAICPLAGVIVIALPSPVIVRKFHSLYEKRKKRKEVAHRL